MGLSSQKTLDYIKNTKNKNLSLRQANKVFNSIRNIISDYFKKEYKSEKLGLENAVAYYSEDETL